MDRAAVHREMMDAAAQTKPRLNGLDTFISTGSNRTSAVLMQRDLCPENAVVCGLLKGK